MRSVVKMVLPSLDVYPHGYFLELKSKNGIFVDKKKKERVLAHVLRDINYGGVRVVKIQLDRQRTVPFWVRVAERDS